MKVNLKIELLFRRVNNLPCLQIILHDKKKLLVLIDTGSTLNYIRKNIPNGKTFPVKQFVSRTLNGSNTINSAKKIRMLGQELTFLKSKN